jgi:hypothetical protein
LPLLGIHHRRFVCSRFLADRAGFRFSGARSMRRTPFAAGLRCLVLDFRFGAKFLT